MFHLTERETAQLTCKPESLLYVKGVVIRRERWDQIVQECPKFGFDQTIMGLERALVDAAPYSPDHTVFVATCLQSGRAFLVNTGGFSYPRYVGEVGIRP